MNTKQLKQIKHNHRVKNEKKKKTNRHSVITEKISKYNQKGADQKILETIMVKISFESGQQL